MSRIMTWQVVLLGLICAGRVEAQPATREDFHRWAATPPMGWNSWDCFGPAVTEQQVVANAQYLAKNLKSHGWDLVTIDSQWARSDPSVAKTSGGMDLEMDEHGRLLPAPNRFPSSRDSGSFKPLADKIHKMGLKFGLHLLRGIPRLAVQRNTLVPGTQIHAADIADKTSTCRWLDDIYGIDTTKPGAQAYYDSLFALLASWEIDFIKVDDLSPPYRRGEIEAIRRAIDKTGRRIVFSTSPGPVPPEARDHMTANANTYRISHDFWDKWPVLYEQFGLLSEWMPQLSRGGFADADMLPIGSLRLWQPNAQHWTKFTHDEQITLMTLWSIARCPLIIGGNLPDNDVFTLSLLTNDDVIAVNQHSEENHHVFKRENVIAWMARANGSKDVYVAIFNAGSAPLKERGSIATTASTQPDEIMVQLIDLGLNGSWNARDLWTRRDLGEIGGVIQAKINPHGAVLYRLQPLK